MTQATVLNELDRAILNVLLTDARVPDATLAARVGRSTSAVKSRMQQYGKLGIIEGYAARVDYPKLGFGVTAFVGLSVARDANTHAVVERLEHDEAVLACYQTTGAYGILIKVICEGRETLEALMAKLEGFEQVETVQGLIVLDTPFERAVSL